ncbi:MAG: hypothetical protein KAY24_10755, partial [Candidatus Eisenbacteria sp.]|nr:hypothetical protein [Candidatus Eisenbacteria bacterium]
MSTRQQNEEGNPTERGSTGTGHAEGEPTGTGHAEGEPTGTGHAEERESSGAENRPSTRAGGGGRRQRGRSRARGKGKDFQAPREPAVQVQGPLFRVTFRGGRVETFYNPRKLVLRPRDFVLVEAERGTDLGWVTDTDCCDFPRRKRQAPRELLRHATADEIARLDVLKKQDCGALEVCRERAGHFGLEMKVIDAETQFDGNRVTFYFTAEKRVDFRELVRDLASIFRTRIELRQVGARDAARRCDGIGPCGRQLCCTTLLGEFEPVTLKMAKEQDLSLNPAKISGACGRLMCCLTYECAAYQDAVRLAPEVGSRWSYRSETWTISGWDLRNRRLFIADPGGETLAVDLDEFREQATEEQAEEQATEEQAK